jgi:hypothetical protein
LAFTKKNSSVFTGLLISGTELFVARFEVITAVTMKNVVFWDMKTQFLPHRRYITSPLQSQAS